MNDEDEYMSMVDFAVSCAVREIIFKIISDKVDMPYPDCRKILIELLKEEKEAPENIRCWFERVM